MRNHRSTVTSIRSFIALKLTPEVHRALARLQESLRGYFPQARWTRPEGIHLTLKFLGGIAPEKVKAVALTLDQIAEHHRSFTLKLNGVGAFPRLRSPRVIWVGIAGSAELRQLQREVETSLKPLGFDEEVRPFHGHLTLARFNGENWSEEQRRFFLESAPVIDGMDFPVDEIVLFRSELSPYGATYTPLHSSPFAPPKTADNFYKPGSS